MGLLDVIDAETGALTVIDTSDRKLRREFQEVQARRRRERTEMLNRNEVGLIELETGRPYATVLVRFFRRRARMNRR